MQRTQKGLTSATQELKALLEISKINRKTAWHSRLITCLPQAVFSSGDPEIIFNPAGFTYYNLELTQNISEENTTPTRYTLPELIDAFLINEGVGIAIEAKRPEHAIDLSYGDVVGFYLNRTFAEPEEHLFQTDKPRAKAIREGVDILISDVPESILPDTSITLLTEIMRHFGIPEPEIKLVYLPETEQHELVFSVPSSLFSAEKTQALVQKLGWFLPRFYSYLACDLSEITPLIQKH